MEKTMAVPRNRMSNARKNLKRSHHAVTTANLSVCPNCGKKKHSHSICSHCGYYKGINYKGET